MTCPCGKALPAPGDPKGHVTASAGTAGLARARKPRGVGAGKFCVFAKKSGKTLQCFSDEAKARRVATGFGSGFGLRER